MKDIDIARHHLGETTRRLEYFLGMYLEDGAIRDRAVELAVAADKLLADFNAQHQHA